MSYYYRNNKGSWFVKDGDKLTPVEFSASMEIAYKMGKIEIYRKIMGEKTNENQV